jgi:very-short-patch-repair endonuclease
LLELGLTYDAIRHRLQSGRLHRVMPGIYSVGRPALSQDGRWMAAVLRCGPNAMLSHATAAAAWGIRHQRKGPIEISVMAGCPRPRGIRVHRRSDVRPVDTRVIDGIPVSSPCLTLVDLAARLDAGALEAAINEADKLDRITPDRLRLELGQMARHPGTRRLRELLDRQTFVLTDSELERQFLLIARAAGLPIPVTGAWLNGFKVDFFWPDLGLVVETDGLRYHRTPAQQATDRVRDQAHAAAGLTPLRFTHAQVRYEAGQVRRTLAVVSARLARDA